MCLAIPVRIRSITGTTAETEADGVVRSASLLFVPDARVGDYVIVHAGFAIQKLDPDDARETLALLKEMADAEEANPPRARPKTARPH